MRSFLIRLLCIASAVLFNCKRSPAPSSNTPPAESEPAAEASAASAAPRLTVSSPDYRASLQVRGTAAAGCEATCSRNGVKLIE